MAADVISNVLTQLGQTTQPVGRLETASAATEASRTKASVLPLPATHKDEYSAAKGDSLVQIVDELNESTQYQQRSIQFNIDKESGRTIIRVIDVANDELIRQIPPEEVVKLAERMQEFRGTLLQAEA
ncbi:MAG TPA: flagellar protein FlaG [Chromatiales bacterium]|nr:flagellar protein FlaG [Chromatiales bacterium]